jgi:hypothetical protein
MEANNKSLKEIVAEYVGKLDPEEYRNISSAMNTETSKQRILELIEKKLLTGCKIKDCVMEIEVSLYE